jgi:hypothetical protein
VLRTANLSAVIVVDFMMRVDVDLEGLERSEIVVFAVEGARRGMLDDVSCGNWSSIYGFWPSTLIYVNVSLIPISATIPGG